MLLDFNQVDKFTVVDATGGTQDVYVMDEGEAVEMPPDPPQGAHNVRFASGNLVEVISGRHGLKSIPIHLKSVTYPVTLTWNLRSSSRIGYWVRRGARRDVLSNNGSIVFNQREDDLIKVEGRFNQGSRADGESVEEAYPSVLALHDSYPNPFNPSTEFRFDLPGPTQVYLGIFDILGREVTALVNERREAGYHSVTWNAQGKSSGIYFARFVAQGTTGGEEYSKLQKVVLMK